MIDLDIRTIKVQLGMDVLRCQSPEMVRKEIWTCLRAYNLIRKTILESAKRSDLSPRQISFTAAMQKDSAYRFPKNLPHKRYPQSARSVVPRSI